MTPALLLIGLLAGHAVADYPLQGDFLAKAKNRAMPLPGVPWYQGLGAHCAIHAGMVALLTGLWPLALAEFVIHWLTDDAKCIGRFGEGARAFNIDQSIHIACKVAWWMLTLAWFA